MTNAAARFSVGQRVIFGRPNGERTLGEIVKMNPSKAKVKTLEGRGALPNLVGVVWGVPYSLMTPVETDAPVVHAKSNEIIANFEAQIAAQNELRAIVAKFGYSTVADALKSIRSTI